MFADLSPVALTLTVMTGLLIKHAIADYGMQTAYMVCNKGRYLHPGGILHAGLHAMLTAAVLVVFAPGAAKFIAMIALGEFLVHYHIDYGKERICSDDAITPQCARFWQIHGFDQLLHALTYIAIAAIFVPTLVTPG
ncbi:MAG: DUF3307 domain-containing protein [Pseudomonadota bacterium]